MLIRVDVYPEGATEASSTLHACLATSTSNSNKALLSVGRKAGDVTFPQDKSVSRQHCQLVVVGEDEICHRKPQNDKEIKACETSPLHKMCLVLENVGEGGSYVAIPKPNTTADHDKMDDDDWWHDTDDEGISQQKSLKKANGSQGRGGAAPLSAATCQHWNEQPVQLHKLDADESYVLDFTNTTNSNTIMIQCGRFESTFRLTRMDWNIAFSRVPTATMKSLRQQLPLVGAVAVPEDLPDANTTHLVTSERVAGAKQLIAWCYQIPLTSSDFVQALLDRKTAADPLPTPADYPVPQSDSKSFWDMAPNPKLLANYHFLSIESNELERLAVAAGAQLVALYDEDEDYDPLAKAQEILQQEGVVAFALPSRKKLSKQLQQLQPSVHMVTAKQLASSISQQTCPLVDSKGNVIVVANSPPAAPAEEATVDDPIKKTTTSRKPSIQEENVKPEPESPVKSSKPASLSSNRRRVRDDESSSEPPQESSATIETETTLPPPKKKSKVVEDEEEPEMSFKSAAGMNSRLLSTIPEPEQEQDSSLSFEQESSSALVVEQEQKPTPPLARPVVSLTKNAAAVVALGDKDANGWFVAAPKDDNHRKEIRKRAAKLMAQEHGGFAFLPPAATATVTVTVATRLVETQPPTTTTTSSVRSSTTTTTGPNFKKFRKNSIRKPGRQARIAVRHELPKESKKQKVLEEQHQELEEERRIADELFGDQAKTVKKRRRA
jgi:hypothetical protein